MSKQATTKLTSRKFAIHNWHKHPMVLPVTLILSFFFISIVLFVSVGATTIGASDSRVVQLSIDDELQVIPTRAETVGELLNRLEIELEEQDIVRPSPDTEIIENDFEIEIYTARAVLITDEGETTVIETAEQSPHGIAEEAGIEVHPEDIIQRDASVPVSAHEVLQEGVVSERFAIERATPIALNFYGTSYDIRTHAETVGQLLDERGLELRDDEDTLEPSADTELTNNMHIFLARIGTEIEVVEEPIEPPIETVQDPSLLMGETQVREEGTPGLRAITYEIEIRNGEEHDRTVLQKVVVREPVARVVAEGTQVPPVSNPSANVEIGRELAAGRGWGEDQFGCLYQLWQRESGWSHTAHNRSSGAYGIPQSLPGSKMASVGSDWRTNPATQITWGLNYIQGRYGSPCEAYSFFLSSNWY